MVTLHIELLKYSRRYNGKEIKRQKAKEDASGI
jgi:hypothetical protein